MLVKLAITMPLAQEESNCIRSKSLGGSPGDLESHAEGARKHLLHWPCLLPSLGTLSELQSFYSSFCWRAVLQYQQNGGSFCISDQTGEDVPVVLSKLLFGEH